MSGADRNIEKKSRILGPKYFLPFCAPTEADEAVRGTEGIVEHSDQRCKSFETAQEFEVGSE